MEVDLDKLICMLEETYHSPETGLAALTLHKKAETSVANYFLHVVKKQQEEVEKKRGCDYRVNLLHKINEGPTPICYTFGPTGRRKRSNITVNKPLQSSDKKNLIDIMVDVDVTAWVNVNGLLEQRKEKPAVGGKRKRRPSIELISLQFNKDQFARGRRGLWETAVNKFLKEITAGFPTVAQKKESLLEESPVSPLWTGYLEKDADVDTTTATTNYLTPENLSLDESIADPCYNCEYYHRETAGKTVIVCSALLCRRNLCDSCFRQQNASDSSGEGFDELMFYCDRCNLSVADWEIDAELLTERQVKLLCETPMDLENISEANVWHFYIKQFLQKTVFLPPSIQPKLLAAPNTDPKLARVLSKLQVDFSIPLIGHNDLLIDEKRARDQFKKIIPNKVKYINLPQALPLTKHTSEGDKTNISGLTVTQRLLMNYILDRGDNHSCVELVRNKKEPSSYSIIARKFIPKSTCVLEYGGMHMLGSQMTDGDIGDSMTSITWRVKDHTNESQTVYLQPSKISNYGRFINGVNARDQRKANLCVLKIKDAHGQLRIVLIASRDIQLGEHLFYYYGDSYGSDEFLSVEKIVQDMEWEQF